MATLPRRNTCGSTVGVGANCPINVTFTPATAGIRSAALTITDNALDSPQMVGLAGTSAIPMPFLNQPLVPTSVAPGGPGFTLTVNGTGFVSGATVNWNGVALATTFVSSEELTATVPAANIASPGTASISVANPGSTLTSNVVFFSVTPPTSTVTFSNATGSPIAAGTNPRSIAVADFNGDGKLDLALGNQGSDNLTILLGNGDGTFTPTASSPSTGYGPFSIAVGDFNGDGKWDLAVANVGNNNVTILLGNGDGTFTPAAASPATGTAPYAVAVGDFNGDGKLDLAVVNFVSNNVTILLGNGDGTFTPAAASPATGSEPSGVAVGDFNGDGKLDLAVTNQNSSNVTILLGNGDGTFTPAAPSPATGSGPEAVAVGDFNGDGKLDLAVGIAGTPNLTILLGNGDGTFTPAGSSPATGGSSWAVVLGDFNGDGKLDLAAAEYNTNKLTILLGNGDGTFTPAAASPATGANPAAVAVGDFNRDGRLDLATANSGSNGVSVLLQLPPIQVAGVSPGSLTFSNQNVGTTSGSQPVALSNTGTAALTITGIATNSNFGQTNNCGSSLAASASCTINVTFSPTTTGPLTGTLTITDNNNGVAGSTQTVNLSGTGTAPAVSLSTSSLSFGNQPLSTTSAAQTVTVTNTDTANLSISTVAIGGTNASDFAKSADTCTGATVTPNKTCTVSVTFTPSATGSLSASLNFTDNASNSPQAVSLTGTGTANPVPTLSALSPSSATAGGAAFTLTVTGTNFVSTSTVEWNGTGLTTTYVSGTKVKASVPASHIATARTASVTVVNPTPGGGRSNNLIFTVNNPPLVSLSASGLSFGVQPLSTTSATQTETVTNTGTGNLTISAVTISGTNASDFAKSADTCTGATVIPNGSCAVSVTFKPSAAGTRTASLTIADNALNSPQTVSLSGTGTAASLSATSLSFGAQLLGGSSLKAVTLRNLGSTPLSISSLSVLSIAPLTPPGAGAADFTIQSSSCVAGGSVAGLASCTITVAFKPTAAGVRSATLVIADSDPSSPQTVNLRGMGTAVLLSATFPRLRPTARGHHQRPKDGHADQPGQHTAAD